MGTRNGFQKRIKALKRKAPDALPANSTIFVDVSFVMHAVQARNIILSNRIFLADPTDSDIDILVNDFALALINFSCYFNYLDCLFVFEGKAIKPKSANRVDTAAKKVNEGIREAIVFPKLQIGKDAGQKKVAQSMGRPPHWFVNKVIRQFKTWDKEVLVAEVQADFAIMQHARLLKSVTPARIIIVISCDYDFIALAPYNSVDALLDPTRRSIIWIDEVFERLEVSSNTLSTAYCVGGCDDIATNLHGVGFVAALDYAKKQTFSLESLCENFGKFSRPDLECLFRDTVRLAQILNEEPPAFVDLLEEGTYCSMIHAFVTRENELGQLLRPGLFDLYTAKKLWILHRRNHVHAPKPLPTPPFQTPRQRNRTYARETAKIPFSTNIFEFLPVELRAAACDDDDDDAPLFIRTSSKKATPKPKAKTKAAPTLAKEVKRVRNASKKADDILNSRYNKSTIKVGSVLQVMNPYLIADGFPDILDEVLLHWQMESNAIRIRVNTFLRRLYAQGGNMMSINAVAKSLKEDSDITSLTGLILLISPHPHYTRAESLSSKKLPQITRMQILQDLVGNLKAMFANNFLRVVIVRTQSLLDKMFDRKVGSGISKLLSAFLMGRRGKLSQEDDMDINANIEGIAHDEQVDNESLESVIAFKRCLVGRRNRHGVTRCDKEVLEFLVSLANGETSLDSIRRVFLPAYLMPLVDQWKTKISAHSYANAPIMWKLFAEVNSVEFKQHLFPTPSTKGRYGKITTTCLSSIFSYYIQKRGVAQLPVNLIPEDLRPSFNHLYWTKIPIRIWNLVFPGISAFVARRETRGQRLEFLHFAAIDSHSIKPLFAKINSTTASFNPSGFNARSWHSHRGLNDQVDLSTLAGNLDPAKRDLGPSSNLGFKGLINFASGIASKEIRTGLNPAKDLLNNRLIVSIDPGLVNLAAITFAYGSFDVATSTFNGIFAKKLVSARSVSNLTGLNDFLAKSNAEQDQLQNLINDLSMNNGRTMDLDEYDSHGDNFLGTSMPLLVTHNSRQSRRNHARLQSKKQRLWSNMVNLIYAVNDLMAIGSDKSPVILFGDGAFANVKGCQSGNYTWLKQYLSRYFTVLIIGEYNTSQRCPKCFQQLQMHEPSKGVRVKRCMHCPGGGPGGTFVVNRDVSAGMNLVTIVLCMVITGDRPAAFSPARS